MASTRRQRNDKTGSESGLLSRCLKGRQLDCGVIRGRRHRLGYKHILYKQKYQWRTDYAFGLDFSPDATQLVATSENNTATIWDIATGNEVRRLVHEDWVYAAKYSPEGDRIATATLEHVRIWDSEDGRFLHKIQVSWSVGVGLFWVYDLLFVVSKDQVRKIKRTTVSEWVIPPSEETSRTALQIHGEFVVSATSRTIRFWDISTHTECHPIQHSRDIESIALSPDDQFIAIAGKDRKITIKQLSHISVSTIVRFNFLALFKFSPPLFSEYTPHVRHQSSRSTTLHSIHGSMTNLRMRTHSSY